MELTLKERKKLTRLTAKKYRQAPKPEKTKIPDVFTEQTGYDRKYAVRILVNEGVSRFANRGTQGSYTCTDSSYTCTESSYTCTDSSYTCTESSSTCTEDLDGCTQDAAGRPEYAARKRLNRS